mmetsp:Transcript_65498/g.77537  ORF Transcript_65498/g.77537 Transcript_65498/m.77537 type:complete len:160 (-) Transcript_65498:113-592(-)
MSIQQDVMRSKRSFDLDTQSNIAIRVDATRRHLLPGVKCDIEEIQQSREEDMHEKMDLLVLNKRVRNMTQEPQQILLLRTAARKPSISNRDELREKLRQRRLDISLNEKQEATLSISRCKGREYGRVDRMLLATKAMVDRMIDGFVEECLEITAYPDME